MTTTKAISIRNRSTSRPILSVIERKDIVMKLIRRVQLINEALSRARTRRPQTANSEATRPARQIMVRAHRENDRLLGL
jgi:hypothetical protein